MPRPDGFVTDTLELLRPLGPVQARAMFGGWGLYLAGRMFALIAEGQLYLKVDEVTREAFRAAGGQPFTYEGAGKRVEMSYWTPPAEAADDARELLPWARRAAEAAERAAARKRAGARRKAAAGAPPAGRKRPAKRKRPLPGGSARRR